MLNRLPDLEEEDLRYNLQVAATEPEHYNLVLVFPQWKPHWRVIPDVPIQSADKIKSNLAKLGIFLN